MMSDRDALLDLSSRIGRDPALVQGPGGNTSLKDGGRMLIKASGTWLAEARDKPIMVPIRLDALLDAVDRDDPVTETCVGFVVAEDNPAGLRPSIETTMHAVLPQPVVVHVHCVETIAWAVRENARDALAAKLSGFDWSFVPYARPGRPLTRAILDNLKPGSSVLVLGNHGLVVAGATVAEAEALLRAVQERLRLPVRQDRPADAAALQASAAGTRYQPAADAATHAVSTDPFRFLSASAGSLYPDHVIFLGPGLVALPPGLSPDDLAQAVGRPLLPMIAVEGAGVLLAADATAGARALARCLADVTTRLDPNTRLNYLTAEDEDALVNWDAEKYRQALDRRPG